MRGIVTAPRVRFQGRLTISGRSDCTIATSSFRSRSAILNLATVSLRWPVNAFHTSGEISS
ncbi:MAG TPA: hypothetical protein VJL28_07440 [Gemmatimonadaceae bacterium]|nr:hypothetical protein [Gemmatimonadaceae bacterium]